MRAGREFYVLSTTASAYGQKFNSVIGLSNPHFPNIDGASPIINKYLSVQAFFSARKKPTFAARLG